MMTAIAILGGSRMRRSLRLECPPGHHAHIRAMPTIAWELLSLAGRQWLDGEEEGTEEHLELRNCGRCNSTLSRVVATRVKETT